MTQSAYDMLKSLESTMMTEKEYDDWVIDRKEYTDTMQCALGDYKFSEVAFATMQYENNRISINEYTCVMITKDDEFDEDINDAENECGKFAESDAILEAGEEHPEFRNYFYYPHRHQIMDKFDLYSCGGKWAVDAFSAVIPPLMVAVNFDLPVILMDVQKLHDRSLISKRKCKIYKTDTYVMKWKLDRTRSDQTLINNINSMKNHVRIVSTDPMEF
jgi:hypothetical protein